MVNKIISSKARATCVTFVKYYPVIMQVIMLSSIFDEFYPFSITNWLYPIIGHSLSWDLSFWFSQECSGFVSGIDC